MFRLPYSFLPPQVLQKFSHMFIGLAHLISPAMPFLKYNLKHADIDIKKDEYISMCILATLSFFILVSATLSFLFLAKDIKNAIVVALTLTVIFSLFVFIQQIAYPKMLSRKRIRDIERNLLPALQDIMVQLSSGVSTFNVLVNISASNYGAVSTEFKKTVKKINAGIPQTDALEELAAKNPSTIFRRAIWQIVTGMKAGSDLSIVINETTNGISEEQIIQIQRYGSSLNPLAMFYMLMAIIVPSLGITFIIVISSLMGLPEIIIKTVFWSFFGTIVFLQFMFIGIIKSRRPNLLA